MPVFLCLGGYENGQDVRGCGVQKTDDEKLMKS